MNPCPICKSQNAWRIPHRVEPNIEIWRKEIGDQRSYFWSLCAHCATGYPSVDPDPRVLALYWAANRSVGPSDAAEEASIWRYRIGIANLAAQRAYAVLAPQLGDTRGRFLDIACGLGETVALFQHKGWMAEGIDADPSTVAFHARLGVKTRVGRFEDDTLPGRYDVIQIAHAIYFMLDPLILLLRVRERLNPGGHLLIVISDFLASTSDNLPGYPHTFYPCAASMRYALGRAGFQTVAYRKWGGSLFFVARQGEVHEENVSSWRALLGYRTQRARLKLVGEPARILASGIKQVWPHAQH